MKPNLQWLELKVPPLLVMAVMAVAMWAGSTMFPGLSVTLPSGLKGFAASGIALCGALVSLAGVLAFRRAGTTVNPLTPKSASHFVAGGIYRYSRNPMYLGFLLVLAGFALFLAHALGALFPFLFVLYMNRFQIAPEEAFLATRFGEAFRTYCAAVPRWI